MSSPASAAHSPAHGAGQASPPDMDATYRKIAWRLIPFLVLLFILAWIDRVNVGFAKLQMLDDLHSKGNAPWEFWKRPAGELVSQSARSRDVRIPTGVPL